MRLRMQGDATVRVDDAPPSRGVFKILIKAIDLRRPVVETLRPQEEAVPRATRRRTRRNTWCSSDSVRRVAKLKLRPRPPVKAGRNRNSLDQSGLASPILTYEEGYLRMQYQCVEVSNGR